VIEARSRTLADFARNAGDWEGAESFYASAVAAATSPAERGDASAWLGLSRLARGNSAGWIDFEQRFNAPDQEHFAPRDDAYWCGDAVASLLLWAEGGRGNVVQFSRYVQAVAERFVLPIDFAVHPELVSFTRSYLVSEDVTVRPMLGADLGPDRGLYAAHASILSLPAIFQFKGWSAPPIPPLVRAPRRRVPLRIGVNWAGNPKYWDDARRSAAAYPFAALEDLRKVQIVELQPSPAVLASPAVLGPAFIEETLQVLGEVDLVISTDTAIAHVAGALGIPTWVLLHDACNWRWTPLGLAQKGGPLSYASVERMWKPDAEPWADYVARVVAPCVAELVR